MPSCTASSGNAAGADHEVAPQGQGRPLEAPRQAKPCRGMVAAVKQDNIVQELVTVLKMASDMGASDSTLVRE